MPPLPVSGRDLTLDNVVEVARGRRPVALDPAAAERMEQTRGVVDRLVAEGPWSTA
jgi:histidine ammonia-lyase